MVSLMLLLFVRQKDVLKWASDLVTLTSLLATDKTKKLFSRMFKLIHRLSTRGDWGRAMGLP